MFRVSGLRVQGSGFRVQGVGFGVWGLGFRDAKQDVEKVKDHGVAN